MAATAPGATFLVPTWDRKIGRSLFVNGIRDEMATLGHAMDLLESLGAFPSGADSLVDVGANIGTTSITALRSHGFESAFACEPEPLNHQLLTLNGLVNDLGARLHALPLAVSDKRGVAELRLSDTNSGGHMLVPQEKARSPKRRRRFMPVEVVSLDYLADRGVIEPERVKLLWIDAQGHEGHILMGATSLVERGVPIVLEFHPAMLEKAGGLMILEQIVSERYTHFVDLRHARDTNGTFALKDSSEINSLSETFRECELTFSDIMLVRLSGRTERAKPG